LLIDLTVSGPRLMRIQCHRWSADLVGPGPLYEDGPVGDTGSDIEVALSAAAAGVAVVRAAYGTELTRHAKSDRDFATDADLDSERAILDVIAAARPDDARVGEETGETDGAGSRRWLVDPLCGTFNFAAQTPLFAVNVALVDDELSSLASVSADPIADETFWSDGQRACRRRDGSDEPLDPSAESRLVDINCESPADGPFVGPQLVADPAFRAAFGPRVISTTLAVAWVAAGRRAAYVSDGFVADSVHFAAGIGLCRGAGCVVTDLAGEPLNTGRGLIVAADAEIHGLLVEIVRPHLDDVLSAT
jgi:myo-inositol-1(or 4)-monophosphatase